LIATGFAWIAFVGLRALGRRHMERPNLGAKILAVQQHAPGDADYYI
jgi:hypothetical protein